jgi:hypothetical protein
MDREKLTILLNPLGAAVPSKWNLEPDEVSGLLTTLIPAVDSTSSAGILKEDLAFPV